LPSLIGRRLQSLHQWTVVITKSPSNQGDMMGFAEQVP